MCDTVGDKIKVSASRTSHFNWRGKICMQSCYIECAKYCRGGVQCYKSSEKEKLLPGGNFRQSFNEGSSFGEEIKCGQVDVGENIL